MLLDSLASERRAAVMTVGDGGAGVTPATAAAPPPVSAERLSLSGAAPEEVSARLGLAVAGETPAIPRNESPVDPIKLWVAAERLPQLLAVFPDASVEPTITAPASFADVTWSREDALVELVRGRLEALGPVTAKSLALSTGIPTSDIDAALLKLEAEGFVLRGRFTPGIEETEWCARRLLARIHSYTLNRLRQEIEPVSSSDFDAFPVVVAEGCTRSADGRPTESARSH